MKVLHLVAGELEWGAARGAYWLHMALKGLGVDSKILTNSSKRPYDQSVLAVEGEARQGQARLLGQMMERLPRLLYGHNRADIFSSGFAGNDFTRSTHASEADIIHLHWINGFVNMRHLSKVKKPLVWTMRDMWPMTGGCHYSMGCENYRTGCGSCRHLRSRHRLDWSRLVVKRKAKYIPTHIRLVGVSSWLSEKARESSLFRTADIRTIHNNIPTQEFYPMSKAVAREALGIRTDKRILAYGAAFAQNGYKGFDKLWDALKVLDRKRYLLLSFGNFPEDLTEQLGFENINVGYVGDNALLRSLYSASDAFVAPSIMEAFGKTLAEAMACGTPVVCFDATGPKDIVTHKLDGYKARPFDPQDLAHGIEWVCGSENYDALCREARDKVLRLFDNEVIAKQYCELYEEAAAALSEV